MANNPYKNISSLVSAKKEKSTFETINDSGLTFTLCDRTDLLSKEANYFISFRLPYTSSQLDSGSTFCLANPEIFQFNVDKIVISPVPRDLYSEILDGRSITFTVPQFSGATSMSAKTVVSSTYGQLEKSQNSSILGNNIAYLFSDDINLPRTGSTNNISNKTRTTWDITPFIKKKPAHGYAGLIPADINTDQRPWSSVNLAVPVTENYPTTTNKGYNYDIPVGFVALDKGFVVLTHPDLVDNIPWTLGYEYITNTSNAGPNSGTTNIYFDNTSVSELSFNDISIEFKTSVVCLALPTEFVFSSNPSWNLDYNLQELANGTNGFDPVQVTEIGLYNKKNELIAIAKMDRPVEKTYTNLITFNLDIDV